MRLIAIALALLACAGPSAAADGPVEVDLELVLMVDVSRSMTPAELELQRRGYASALRSAPVLAAIGSGMLGRIALTYVEWAATQHVVVDWRLVGSRADLDDFADRLTVTYNPALRRTSISGAVDFGTAAIGANRFHGLRRVIDISGDGPNNQGRRVTAARDAALAAGVTVNGLPLMTRDGIGSAWQLDRLDIYYRSCVIGGPGAFVLPVLDWVDFEAAVRRKLVMEIAGLRSDPPPLRVQMTSPDPTDCLIGEKLWDQRRRQMGGFDPP